MKPVLKDPAGTEDPWYLGALDFRTGRPVYKTKYGTGFGYNVNYAPVSSGCRVRGGRRG